MGSLTFEPHDVSLDMKSSHPTKLATRCHNSKVTKDFNTWMKTSTFFDIARSVVQTAFADEAQQGRLLESLRVHYWPQRI